MSINEYIELVVQKLVDFYSPYQIYLFGSQAREDSNMDSDIDFFVIKESTEPRHKRALDFRRNLRGNNSYPIDILVYTPQEFYEERNIKGTIPYHIIKEGKLLYGPKN
ncbi:MAG TPA: nucleotidyltransferase domain-containing protein [Bacillota bacterium]|nr:nucleotidyltransferase domain-containing protein [Bacillota bacterium]